MFEIKHLKYAKQSYFSHLFDTLKYSYYSFNAGVIFLIHGFLPCIFTKKGSTIINNLNEIIIEKRSNLEKLIQ
jgi:Family of unknown function (DUF6356)